ncbi:FAD-dependent monooxygenase [Pseudorhodoferax sp.]|uniref:FAD-dependent monooxygenase n=1 Tax=Pseudorhodoferax sp. TaxID=1993553 RepID=UPI002DD61E25|nr:FAD-dependent monooxygenase [Pseudorhodoferax sp.]
MTQTAMRLAVVGAGPAGLALALLAARTLPHAQVSLFDARPLERDVSGDPRTLALSLGSVQMLQRLQAWPAAAAEPITQVHVSQAPPSLPARWGRAEVCFTAAEQGVPSLGAVLAYGPLVAALQQTWLAAVAADPDRLASRFGAPVQALRARLGGVAVQAGDDEHAADLAVVAEGGVFAEQARKALAHDYRQTAWVGTVRLDGAPRGAAFERFTRHGPLALLPLLPDERGPRAAMVWCVDADDDPVRTLDDTQRRLVLATLLPAAAGRIGAVGPLKHFALGLNAERTLVEGRVVRIGNAAQTLHPVAGQGLNLGLRDAQALIDTLRFGSGAIDPALRRVEWARAPDRWATIATTDFLARSFTWGWPGLGVLRGAGMAALQALPPLKHALARQMMFGRR